MINSQRIVVPKKDFRKVEQAIKQSGVKFYPFSKTSDGYEIEFTPQDHPLVSYLLLKYDVSMID